MEHQSKVIITNFSGRLLSVRYRLQNPVDSEQNSGLSVSVPDLSYSVRDLVQHFAVGTLPSDVVRSVLYTDNPDFDDFVATELPDFDLVDADRELRKLRELHNLRMSRKAGKDIPDKNPIIAPDEKPDSNGADDVTDAK